MQLFSKFAMKREVKHSIRKENHLNLLLKKVEELTLYIIKQQEQLDKQATEIKKLKK